MKEQILSEIRRLAASNGQPPGHKLFARETGIAEHQWRGKFWARWGDALVEAGYTPNEWTGRLDSDAVLIGVVAACRHFKRFPTQDEIQLYRRSEPAVPSEQAMRRHFGGRAGLIAALAKLASQGDEYADIAALLPRQAPVPPRTRTNATMPDGFVYLIKSGDSYKIGRSDNLERRIKEIRVALPEKAILLHSIQTDDPPGIEAYWHNRFRERRANGEWFLLSPTDIAAFKKRKYQ